MGSVPLDWPDVLAYADGTGAVARGPDVATLYHMIRAYCAENDAATGDALRIAPAEREKG